MLRNEVVATGGEDGRVCLWRLVESRVAAPPPSEPVKLGKILQREERAERRYKPY